MADEEQAWFEKIQGIPWHRLDEYTRELLLGSRGSTQWHTVYIEFIAYHLAMLKAPKKLTREVLNTWVKDPFLQKGVYEVVEQQYAKHNVATGLPVARATLPSLKELSPSAQRVYAFMFERGKQLHKNPYAPLELGYADFKLGVQMAINTVRRALEELEDTGYAVLVSKGGTQAGPKKGRGQNVKSSYRLLTPKERQP